MAAVAKSGTPSLSTMLPAGGNYVGSNLVAGAAIAAGDACYVASTGKVLPSNGTAVNAAAKVDGFAAAAAGLNEAVTLLVDVDFYYGAALAPGTRYFLSSATAGALDTAATVGGTAPVAYAIDATRIRVLGSRY